MFKVFRVYYLGHFSFLMVYINLPKVFAFGSHFYPKLEASGFSGVANWTKTVDLFSQDYILIPIHWWGVHWCLTVVDVKSICISYYDSMHGKPQSVMDNLCQYLQMEFQANKNTNFQSYGFNQSLWPTSPFKQMQMIVVSTPGSLLSCVQKMATTTCLGGEILIWTCLVIEQIYLNQF